MKLVYSREAARQLAAILDTIAEKNPRGARNVQRRIQQIIDVLPQYPVVGASAGFRDLRRLVANPYPYVITYRVMQDESQIIRVRHAARRPL